MNRQYYLEDGLGNVRVITDDEGGLVNAYAYDPYGNELTESIMLRFKYRQFTSQDEECLNTPGAWRV